MQAPVGTGDARNAGPMHGKDDHMAMPILATKLFVPPPRPQAVRRPLLVERLQED